MAIKGQSAKASHKQFMKYQREMEKLIRDLHIRTSESLTAIIARNVNSQGTVDKYKIKKIVDEYMSSELMDYRKSLEKSIKGGIISSSEMGIRSIIAEVRPDTKVTGMLYQSMADKINRTILDKIGEDGLTLSDRVWKITDDNVYQLKKIISSDILQGKSSDTISRDIRGFLQQPATLRGAQKEALMPGPGVYKSAYKNAMRVARTETNKAYIEGQTEIAKSMGYKLEYVLNPVHEIEDICDEFNGQIFDPEDAPKIPLHPHCMCYYKTVLPEAV